MEPSDSQWHPSWTWPGDMSGFHVFGQPFGHEIFFLVCLAFQLASFAAAILVLFDRRRRFRLLWSLGSIVGFGKIIMNWTSGEWATFPISIQVPALRVFRDVPAAWGAPPSDWFVAFGIPVVALVYLVIRWQPAAGEADLASST